MSERSWLAHALPGVSSDEEEAVAVVAYVADTLLADYHRQVAALRERAERVSRVAFALALLLFALLLAQDFEFAPIALLVGLGVASALALGVGILLRTRLIEPRRFTPPRVRLARKSSWQWVALPLGRERGVVLWDTLLDEAVPLDLPATPPKRDDDEYGAFKLISGSLRRLEDEKDVIRAMGTVLKQWETPPTPVRLPLIAGNAEPLLHLLLELPRVPATTEPPPTLPLARPLDEGRSDMQQLMELHRTQNIFLAHLASWERTLQSLRRSLERALYTTRPPLEAPPAPPSAHPSGDVEALIGTLEAIRSGPIESLLIPLGDERDRLDEERQSRLRLVDEDLERKRNDILINVDGVLRSLQRQAKEMRERALPEVEAALKDAQSQQRAAQERASKAEEEIASKRKQLLMAGNTGGTSPKASDERKQALKSQIEHLENSLPDVKRAVITWNEVVETQRRAVEREKKRLDSVEADVKEHETLRDQRVREQESAHQAARATIESDYAPSLGQIEGDLAYFRHVIPHFTAALEPYRMDLVMDDAGQRPYTQVFAQNQQIPEDKIAAMRRWDERIHQLIAARRATVERVVSEVNRAALSGDGLDEEQLFYLPVWYVETQSGTVSLRPGAQKAPTESFHLIAPFVPYRDGRRMAIRGAHAHFMQPHPQLQERLELLLKGPRRDEVLAAARTQGQAIVIEPELLNDIAIGTEMPRALTDAIVPSVGRAQRLSMAPLVLPEPVAPPPVAEGAGEPPPWPPRATVEVEEDEHEAASDEFVPAAPLSDDAWPDDVFSADEGYSAPNDDAWENA